MTPAQREALRPAFERRYPLPSTVLWSATDGRYVPDQITSSIYAVHHNLLFEGFCAAFESLGEPVAVFDVVNQGASKLLLTGAHPRIPAGRHPLYRLPQGE